MFKDNSNPTMDELIHFLMVNHTELVDSMQNSYHAITTNEPNSYHSGDNSIWTHTMMVCLVAELNNFNKIVKIAALLHDIGKPIARTEEKWIDKPGRPVRKSGLKASFIGHEGLSSYISIDILNDLEKLEVINENDKNLIFSIISLHGSLFEYIGDSGLMINTTKILRKFSYDMDLYSNLVNLVKCDSLGRFADNIDSRKNNANRLGLDVFTIDELANFNKNKRIDITPKTSEIVLLVGPQGCGKSTFIKDEYKDYTIISRDSILLEYGKEKFGNIPYSEIWNLLDDGMQKEIDFIENNLFTRAVNNRENIVIDKTNISPKARRRKIGQLPKSYKKVAILFLTGMKDLTRISNERINLGDKLIDINLINKFIKGFTMVTHDEVDEIKYIWRKELK